MKNSFPNSHWIIFFMAFISFLILLFSKKPAKEEIRHYFLNFLMAISAATLTGSIVIYFAGDEIKDRIDAVINSFEIQIKKVNYSLQSLNNLLNTNIAKVKCVQRQLTKLNKKFALHSESVLTTVKRLHTSVDKLILTCERNDSLRKELHTLIDSLKNWNYSLNTKLDTFQHIFKLIYKKEKEKKARRRRKNESKKK